jgi:hypothetical protein
MAYCNALYVYVYTYVYVVYLSSLSGPNVTYSGTAVQYTYTTRRAYTGHVHYV